MTTNTKQKKNSHNATSRPKDWTRIEVTRDDSVLLTEAPLVDKAPNRDNPRVALYMRRSLRTDTSASMSRQRAEMEERARRIGATWDPERDVYEDDDITARGGKFRPAIESLIAAMKQGHYDGVVIWDYSRWTRNRGDHRILAHIMRSNGVEVYSVVEEWLTLHGPMGMMVVDLLANVAASESEKISARLGSWYEQMTNAGAALGKAPFGLVKVDAPSPFADRTAPIQLYAPDLEPREDLGGRTRASLVVEAFARAQKGDFATDICADWAKAGYVNGTGRTFTAGSIVRMLNNPRYAGYVGQGRTEIRLIGGKPLMAHTPVIDPEVFHAVRSRRRPRAQARPERSALSGVLKCGSCGCTMGYEFGLNGRVPKYRCTRGVSPLCARRSVVAAEHVIAFVFDAIAVALSDEERLLAAQREPAGAHLRRLELERELAGTYQALEELDKVYFGGGGFTDPGARSRYESTKKMLQDRAAQLTKDAKPASMFPRFLAAEIEKAGSVRAALDNLTNRQRLSLVTVAIDHVKVEAGEAGKPFNKKRCHIVWRDA